MRAPSLTRRELLLAAFGMVVLTMLAFAPHAVHGGFYLDDWTNWERYKTAGSFWDGFRVMYEHEPSGNHILTPLVYATGFLLFADHAGPHLALVGAEAGAIGLLLFVALRLAGSPQLPALAAGALVIVWPWSDASKLWIGASPMSVATAFVLLGVVLSLLAFRQPTRGRALALHAGGVACYLVGNLTYEIVAGLVAAAAVSYLAVAPWRRAARRWVVDLAAAAAGPLAAKAHLPVSEVQPLDGLVGHAGVIADQALTLLARTVEPFGDPSRLLVLALLAIVFVAAGVAAWRTGDPHARRRMLIGPALAAAGIVAMVAGYAAVVPANDSYQPLAPGQSNRINTAASIGMALVAAGMVAGVHSISLERLGRRAAQALAAAVAIILVAGNFARLTDDRAAWRAGYEEQTRLLQVLRTNVPKPESGSFVYLVGHRDQVAPGVPTFAWVWDLNGVVKLLWRDSSLGGLPVLPGTVIRCGAEALVPRLPGQDFNPYLGSPYKAVFVTAQGRVERVSDPSSCRRVVRRLVGHDALATT